ncbi:MAG TPA: DUF559 domain-containing protein [Propionicimonas sp.]|nr:DUF559 domain-containing protein [Propionicimonas sp.]
MDRIEALLATEGLILLREHPELSSTLYRRWHEGLLRRLHPGVYVGSAPVSESLRLLALCRWAPRAVLHGTTGAALWLDEWGGGSVELANPVRLAAPPGVRVTLRRVEPEHVWRLRGLAVASAAYCAAELAAVDDGRTAMRMFLAGVTSVEAVEAATHALAGTQGNTVRCRVVSELASSPWSPAERVLHQLLRAAGIAGWVANATIRVEGRRLCPDVLMRDRPLVIEVDGYAFHGGRVAFQKDRERLNLFAQAGFTVLRFTWEDLTENPATVVTRIRRTLHGMNLHVDGASGA